MVVRPWLSNGIYYRCPDARQPRSQFLGSPGEKIPRTIFSHNFLIIYRFKRLFNILTRCGDSACWAEVLPPEECIAYAGAAI